MALAMMVVAVVEVVVMDVVLVRFRQIIQDFFDSFTKKRPNPGAGSSGLWTFFVFLRESILDINHKITITYNQKTISRDPFIFL